MSTATLTRPKTPGKSSGTIKSSGTMSLDELNTAIDQCGSVFIRVRFAEGEKEVSFLRWRDKSFAIRRKIRALATDLAKRNRNIRFAARIADTGGIEKTLIVGD
jgi:hypothetical protein